MLEFQYGVPYTEFFSFSKTFGQDWYTFGLGAGSGYQAIARASALKAELEANASVSAGLNVILFSNTFPVLDGFLGAGNNLKFITRTSSGLSLDTQASTDKKNKWLPKITASVKLFGITIWEKKLPDTDDTAKADKNQSIFDNAVGAANAKSEQIKDQFEAQLKAAQTTIGGGGQNANMTDLSGRPMSAADLKKDLLDFKKGVKDLLGAAIIIPIFPPLNIEIDFGVFFSHTLMFELGIEGMGFSLRAGKDLGSASGGQSIASQLKSGLKSNELVGGMSSMLSGNFSGTALGLLKSVGHDGLADLSVLSDGASAAMSTMSSGVGGLLNSEIKASVRIMPAISAGAFVKAAAVLDLYIASAEAGVKGTLNLVQAKAGGALEFSSAADYADLVASGTMTLLSGMLELYATVEINAIVYSDSWTWSKVLFDWPGKTFSFMFPIARLAYRDQGAPRVFMCINGSFERATHPFGPENVDECDHTVVRLVPSDTAQDISADIKELVKVHGLEPPEANRPCTVIINANTILATPASATTTTACADQINSALSFSNLVDMAHAQYPDKFVSGLYDDFGKPAILFEAYFGASVVAAKYVTNRVGKYSPVPWATVVAAAIARGTNDPVNNPLDPINYVPRPGDNPNTHTPEGEPQLALPGGQVAVREIGWLDDDDLLLASQRFKTGFCRAEAMPSSDAECSYRVKALGVGFPDGKGCVPRDFGALQRFGGQVDCAPMANDGAKVAACLLRKAFEQEYCYPPGRAEYIVNMVAIVEKMTAAQLLNSLLPANKLVSSGGAVVPGKDTACGVTASRDQTISWSGEVYVGHGDGCWCCGYNPCNDAPWDSLHTGHRTACEGGTCNKSHRCYYKVGTYVYTGKCNVSFAGKGFQCTDNSGTCNCTSPSGNTDAVAEAFRTKLYDGVCEINLTSQASSSVVIDDTTIKPNTCELITGDVLIQGKPAVLDTLATSGKNKVATRAECRDAYGSNLTQLCRTANTNAVIAVNTTGSGSTSGMFTFRLSSRFQGDLVDELGQCKFDRSNGSVVGLESTGSLTSATDATKATVDSCEVLVGNNSLNKLIVAKVFKGFTADGISIDPAVRCVGMLNPISTSTGTGGIGSGGVLVGPIGMDPGLLGGKGGGTSTTPTSHRFCAQIDPAVVRSLRAAAIPNLSATELYVRVNTFGVHPSHPGSNPQLLIGALRSVGTCNFTEPPPSSGGMCVDPVTKKQAPCAVCELLATNAQGNKILIGRANQSSQTACSESFKPYSQLCERMPVLPEVRKELAANTGAFVNGSFVPVTVRFTPSGGTPVPIPIDFDTVTSGVQGCKFGVLEDKGTSCELLVNIPGVTGSLNMNGTNQTLSGTTWMTKKLSSKSEPDLNACKSRFLTGAVNIGGATGTAAPKLDLTCYGLSSQIAKSTAPSEPGLKGTATTPLTVTLVASFKPSATGAYTTAQLGTCSYRADGSSTLLQAPGAIATTCPAGQVITPAGTCIADPTLTLQTTAGTAAPEITDLVWDTANPGKFNLKVRYNGPRPPLVPYTEYTLSFPGPGTASSGGGGVLNAGGGVLSAGGGAAGLTTTGKLTGATSTTKPATSIGSTAVRSPSGALVSPVSTVGKVGTGTLSGPVSASSGIVGSGGIGSLTPVKGGGALTPVVPPTRYPLPGKDEIKTVGPFDVSVLGGALCQKALNAVVVATIAYPTTMTVPTAPAERRFSKVTDVPCPPANIQITNLALVTGSSPAKFTIDYKNIGGTPTTGQKFDLKIVKTGATAPLKSLSALNVPAMNTSATTVATLLSDVGVTTCGVATSLDVTTSLSTSYKYTGSVTIPCPPPSITVAGTTPDTASGSFKVNYQNIGGAPAANQKFDLTVKNTSATPAKTTTLSAIAVPAKNASPTPQTGAITLATLGMTCGAATKLEITSTASAAGYKYTGTVTVPCPPPSITVAGTTPDAASGSFKVSYQNIGGAPTSGQKFDLTVKNTSATPAKTTTLKALTVPAKNASPTPQTAAITLATLGMTCGAAVNLEITSTVSATGYKYTGSVTIPCPPPRIDITGVTLDLVSNPKTFTVAFKNSGGQAPATAPTFSLSVKNQNNGSILSFPVNVPAAGTTGSYKLQLAGFIPACTTTTASITSKLEIYTSLSPAGFLSTTPVTITCPAIAPAITIADARVIVAPTTAGIKPTLVVDYRNSGGAVLTTSVAASKKFTLTLKNTAVTPNKTATTAAITVPAPATTTTASPAVDFFTLAPACVTPGTKVSANLSVTAATTAPTVAPTAFTKLVEYTCPTPPPPAIAIGSVTPLNLAASGTNFTAPFTVEYSNTGGAPAANQTFSMTVKATSVSTNGGPALALNAALSPITLTIPASTASPKPTTQIADLFALTGATQKCGVTGITSVKASLSITTAVGTTASAAVAKTVTVTCPAPKITITNIIPENNTQLSFLLEYKNTGTAAATGQTFGVTFTNVTKGSGLGYPNLAIPAPNAKATARFQVGALGTTCNVATPVKVTPSIAAAGYVYSATVTIPCGPQP